MAKIKDHSLYLIITEEYARGRSATEIAKSAIAGGVDIIQLREKNKPKEELALLGKKLSSLCSENRVIFIVNDDPLLASEIGAGGVHLGQEDSKQFPVSKAREIIGNDKIVGISTHSVKEFEKANEEDVDYIAFGPIFPTETKDYFLGTNDVPKVLKIARKPVFLIGGINLSNMGELLALGAKNIALIRGVTEAEDIKARTEDFKSKMRGRKMIIKINGKDESVDKSVNIAELISKKGLSCDRIVVEHNLHIVPKEKWTGIALQENDNIEIVSFVGGG